MFKNIFTSGLFEYVKKYYAHTIINDKIMESDVNSKIKPS